MELKLQRKHYYIALSALLFTFFWTWSSTVSLVALWLNQKVGLKGAQTGLMFSIASFTALFAQPLYGFIQDKLALRKHLLWIIGFLLLISGPWFIFVCTPLFNYSVILGAMSLGLYVGLTFYAGIGALESYTERVSRLVDFEYGKSRMWGSLGWAGATFFAGILFNINPNYNFIMASCSAAIFVLIMWHMRDLQSQFDGMSQQKTNPVTFADALALLKIPNFWALVIFVIGTSVYGVYDQQFPTYFASMFTDQKHGNEMFGFLNSFQVVLEAGGMFVAPFLVNRIGAKNGLILSGLVMALRIFGSGMADGPLLISAMKLLHAVELPILLIALFKYVTSQFDARLSATLYLVAFQFVSSICATLLSPVAGLSYDKYGFSDTYFYLALIVLILTIISALTLRSDRANTRAHIESTTLASS